MKNVKDSGSSKWVCPHVEEADPRTRKRCEPDTVCKHLEALLGIPSMDAGDSPKLIGSEQAAQFTINVFERQFWKHDEGAFLTLMRNYGFTDEWDLDLLSAKYFRNLSVRDIEKEFNWTSKSAVQRKLKELRELLRARGIEQELR